MLRSAITTALKQRDRQSAAVYRAALGAIDNAEAVPTGDAQRAGAIESSVVGVGRAEAPRQALSEQTMREIVAAEADERRAAAELMRAGRPDAAEQLRAEAHLLRELLDAVGKE